MGPKVQSAIRYLQHGGKEVIITSYEYLMDALDGKAGTHIVP
jgi:carbamate kinase